MTRRTPRAALLVPATETGAGLLAATDACSRGSRAGGAPARLQGLRLDRGRGRASRRSARGPCSRSRCWTARPVPAPRAHGSRDAEQERHRREGRAAQMPAVRQGLDAPSRSASPPPRSRGSPSAWPSLARRRGRAAVVGGRVYLAPRSSIAARFDAPATDLAVSLLSLYGAVIAMSGIGRRPRARPLAGAVHGAGPGRVFARLAAMGGRRAEKLGTPKRIGPLVTVAVTRRVLSGRRAPGVVEFFADDCLPSQAARRARGGGGGDLAPAPVRMEAAGALLARLSLSGASAKGARHSAPPRRWRRSRTLAWRRPIWLVARRVGDDLEDALALEPVAADLLLGRALAVGERDEHVAVVVDAQPVDHDVKRPRLARARLQAPLTSARRAARCPRRRARASSAPTRAHLLAAGHLRGDLGGRDGERQLEHDARGRRGVTPAYSSSPSAFGARSSRVSAPSTAAPLEAASRRACIAYTSNSALDAVEGGSPFAHRSLPASSAFLAGENESQRSNVVKPILGASSSFASSFGKSCIMHSRRVGLLERRAACVLVLGVDELVDDARVLAVERLDVRVDRVEHELVRVARVRREARALVVHVAALGRRRLEQQVELVVLDVDRHRAPVVVHELGDGARGSPGLARHAD